MNKRTFDKWIKALESGKFKHGRGLLFAHRPHQIIDAASGIVTSEPEGGYCCLGVLERVCGIPPEGISGGFVKHDEIDDVVHIWRGLSGARQRTLALLNDKSDSFTPVIAYLKKNRSKIVKPAVKK